MRILLDMNLSPRWIATLEAAGIEARHWGDVGDPRAPDAEILAWARDGGWVLFTNDLDFSHLLAAGGADGPSVVQLRMHDLLPEAAGDLVLDVLREHAEILATGAVATIDAATARVRLLPLR